MKNKLRFAFVLLVFTSLTCNLPSQATEPAPAAVNTAEAIPETDEVLPAATATTPAPPTLTLAPTFTATASASPTPSVPTALFVMNANCRSKPDKNSDALMSFLKGESAEIVGRNDELDNTWWYVKMPSSTYKCWVSTITADVIGSYDDIPTIPPPY